MQLVKDIEQHKMFLKDGDKTLIEFGFVADEYVMVFYTDQRVPIVRDMDSSFYDSFSRLLKNKYSFSHTLSSQDDYQIMWFSDGYCNLDDEWETCVKSRFLLEREGDTLYFSAKNPFFDEHQVHDRIRTVIFTPAGNGYYCQNQETGHSFQDDVIMIHQNLLEKEKVKEKK